MGHIGYRQWLGPADFASGSLEGAEIVGDRLVMGTTAGTAPYDDPHRDGPGGDCELARWATPVVSPDFGFSELIASWNTDTPAATWVEVSAIVTTRDGRTSKPYALGRWAMDDDAITRTSVPGQGDEIADVAVDVLTAHPGVELVSYQVAVSLHRRAGTKASPAVSLIGVMVSSPAERAAPPVRVVPSAGSGIILDVPPFSQELHKGRYPHLSGGGESWCSPASTAMVLSYFGAEPAPADYSWVDPSYDDPWVIHAAAHSYDAVYGAGNWPFNTAYASELGMRAFVTRLRSLAEVEQLIRSGIPLVVSVSFTEDAMTGAGYSTEGHLMVVVGFTNRGDVVVNDPASHLVASDLEVRTVYDRDEFTAAWMAGSNGVVYVIHPPEMPLPPPPDEPNW